LTKAKQKRLVEDMVVRLLERAGMDVQTTEKPDGVLLDVTFKANAVPELLGRENGNDPTRC
jgi:hypothetical protein